MLYIIIFLSISIISFYLAWKSMKDFREKPSLGVPYGVFLLKNPAFLDETFIDRLYSLALHTPLRYKINPFILSFERLIKGDTSVIAIFAPTEFMKQCNIDVLELEEYADKIPLSSVQSWEICFEGALKDFPGNLKFLDRVSLSGEERIFLQIATVPVGRFHQARFQSTLRFAAVAVDASRRAEISKIIQDTLNKLELKKTSLKQPSSDIFKQYKIRSVVPEETRRCVLGSKEVAALAQFS